MTALKGLADVFEKRESVTALKAAHERQVEDLYAEIGRLTTLRFSTPVVRPAHPCLQFLSGKCILRVYTMSRREARMDSAKLFQNGKSQAVRLPKEYRFRGSKVYIKRMGNAIVLIPEHDSWQSMIESLTLFSDDFMEERVQPPVEERNDLFDESL